MKTLGQKVTLCKVLMKYCCQGELLRQLSCLIVCNHHIKSLVVMEYRIATSLMCWRLVKAASCCSEVELGWYTMMFGVVNAPSMFDVLISTADYEVCSYFLFYDHITTLPMLPHICPLLLEYVAAADAVFMQGSIQRGGWCKVQFDPHVPGSFIMFLVRPSCS